jgi:hypothetical protein
MIVAIIETAVSGVASVEEFRDTVDEATAISNYCNDYSPPLDTGDYTGYDIGGSIQPAPAGGWHYDFDNPGLVQSLSGAKAAKNAAIDARTIELIQQGFQYAGRIFSLSSNAQSYWNGLGNLAANGLLTEPDDFPLTINTLDDSDTYDISSIADAVTIFATAAATVKTHLANGTSLKNQVRSATTISEVDAIVDNR